MKYEYLSEEDDAALQKDFNNVWFFAISYHELLGHGCGKLFQVENGKLNFDAETVKNPITGEKITSWYKENDTWSSVFNVIQGPYEECRAEAIAMYFSHFVESYEILLPQYKDNFLDFAHLVYLKYVGLAIDGLKLYNPDSAKKFSQAHTHGRWVLYKVLVEAGEGLVQVKPIMKGNEESLRITVDKSKIISVGLPAVKKFLL